MLNPNPNVMNGIRKWSVLEVIGHEGRALVNGINNLIKETLRTL